METKAEFKIRLLKNGSAFLSLITYREKALAKRKLSQFKVQMLSVCFKQYQRYVVWIFTALTIQIIILRALLQQFLYQCICHLFCVFKHGHVFFFIHCVSPVCYNKFTISGNQVKVNFISCVYIPGHFYSLPHANHIY